MKYRFFSHIIISSSICSFNYKPKDIFLFSPAIFLPFYFRELIGDIFFSPAIIEPNDRHRPIGFLLKDAHFVIVM